MTTTFFAAPPPTGVRAEDFLRQHLEEEYRTFFGLPPAGFLDEVVAAWMNDATNSRHRFEAIEEHLPGARRILDMASGCGTMVFYGLLNGYDAHGIDPERWKHEFNALKARERGYPADWLDRFKVGIGESLPYPDDHFDCVSTYQTLEHVQDVERAMAEMLRVTRPGGAVHIRCPDYSGTFEGHYRLPWLPFFPRALAKGYLRIMGKPSRGLDTIQYVSKRRLVATLRRLERQMNCSLSIVDVDRESFSSGAAGRRAGLALPVAYAVHRARHYVRRAFRYEETVDLWVHVDKNAGRRSRDPA